MSRMSAEPTAERMTVDELARRAGLPSSTIRLYQTKGLLPPPKREGRVGIYDDGHLARLRLIGQLRQRGFSLAGIKHLIETWQAGQTLDDLLGLDTEGVVVAAGSPPARLPLEELTARFAGQKLTPDLLQRTVRLGLVTVDNGSVTCDAEFLEFGVQLAALGVNLEEILDEWEALLASTSSSARRFVGVFERHVWRPFVEAGMPADQVDAVTDALRRLAPLAQAVTAVALRVALQDAAASFVAEQARRFDPEGALPPALHQGGARRNSRSPG
jgi:DNA-binding transcriptional MerR regulator